jgi:TonB-linked SusC/RagA family outer membrane protein
MTNNCLRKVFRCLLLYAGVLLMLSVKAQDPDKPVSLNLRNARLSDAVNEVGKQTALNFIYSVDDLNKNPPVTINVNRKRLAEVLDQLLHGTDMQYSIEKNTVIIKRKPVDNNGKKNIDTLIRVSGFVLTAKGTPLTGASVEDLSSGRSVITDGAGKYGIAVGRHTSLRFTYVGMKPQTISIHAEEANALVRNVQMEVAPSEMSQVVFTGYQAIRKSEMVGSTTTVKREDLLFDGTNSIEQMLQGKMAGTVVMNNNGLVGTRQRVRVRGTSTLLSNQEPVWVVDGIIQTDPLPFQASSLNDVGSNLDMVRNFIGNSIAWLNPNDIEDVTVLKDAAATVLYGVKAANGVIVIKTKRGKAGRMSVNYSGGIAITEKLNYDRLNLMNSKERIEVSREIYEKRLIGTKVSEEVGYEEVLRRYLDKKISYEQFNNEVKALETVNTNWIDLLYQTPFSHNHTLSISGGTDRITYYTSVGMNQNLGIARGNDSRSLNGTTNLDLKLSDKLTAGIRLAANVIKTNGFYQVDPFKYAQEMSRAIPAYDEDGKLKFYSTGYSGNNIIHFNVLNELAETGNTNDQRSFNAGINVNYAILPSLRFESNLGVTSNNAVGEAYASEYSHYIAGMRNYDFGAFGVGELEYKKSELPHGGEFNSVESRNTSLMVRNSLAWNKLIGHHRLGVLAGQEVRSVKTNGVSSTVYGYFPNRGRNITLPPRIVADPSGIGETDNSLYENMPHTIVDREANYLSWYGSATYSFDERYVITGSLRSDASNRFGQDKRHRFLPVWAGGVRWNVHNEPWMAKQTWLSELNLRASYGWQGNVAENVGPDLIAKLPENVVNSTTGEYELLIKSLGYADLRWEKTKTVNLGLDLGVAKNRFVLSAEYYNKRTEDMIIYKDVPVSYGISSMPVNAGNMSNQGVELTISGTLVRTKDFVWNVSVNTSKNINTLDTDVPRNNQWQNAVSGKLYKQGYAVSSFWVFDYTGLDPQHGYPLFNIPQVADNPKTEQDATQYLVYAGRLDPDFTAGFGTSFRYKWFTLTSSFNMALGGKRFLYNMFHSSALPNAFNNLPKEFVNRWKKPGDEQHTNIPAIPSGIYSPISGLSDVPSVSVPSYEGYEEVYNIYNYSDARVVSGSFLRCNDISLTYNVAENLLKHIGLKNITVMAAVRNPFIIVSKDYKGMDPEVATGNQPIPRVYSMGLNVSF